MKVRYGFVSNSSSSSFLISKKNLSVFQISELIKNDYGYEILENDEAIAGFSSYDGDVESFEELGIDEKYITRG